MITKVNKHIGKESWYGKMSTVSSAEARFLKRREGLRKEAVQQLQLWVQSLYKEDINPKQDGLEPDGAVADCPPLCSAHAE